MAVDIDHLAQRGGEHRGVRIGFLDLLDHALEAGDLGGDILAARIGAFNPQGQLEVLLIAGQDVGNPGNLGKNPVQLFFTVLPERRAVVEVKGDPGAVLFGRPRQLETEDARLGRQGRDQAGQVQDLHPFPAEDAVQVKVLHIQGAADFTGAVVMDARPARAVAAVGDVELVPVAPRPALLHLLALVGHVAASEVVLDQAGDRAVLDEGGQHLDRQAEVGGHAGDIGFRAGGLHEEAAAGMHGLAVGRGDAHPHAGGDKQGVGAVLFQFDGHIYSLPYFGVHLSKTSRDSASGGRLLSTASLAGGGRFSTEE